MTRQRTGKRLPPAAPTPAVRTPAPTPRVLRAAAFYQQGRLAEAEQLLTATLAAAPADPAALDLAGVIATQRGDHARAIRLLRKAVGRSPQTAAYHGNLGRAYLMSGQFAAAADCYRRVLAMRPEAHLARFALGMALLGQRDFPAAAAALAEVVRANPQHVDARANLALVCAELGRHDEAVAHFAQAVALKPDSGALHFKFGLALKATGDLTAACRHLAQAALLEPTLPGPPYELGLVLVALDRLDEAARALDEALTLRPDFIPALVERGQVLNRLQRLDEAAACFERGLARDPRMPLLHLGLARTRQLQGRGAEARALVARALENGGDAAACHTMLGMIEQSNGRFAEAAGAYRRAITARPTYGPAHLRLAVIDKSADPAAQISELSRVLAMDALDGDQRATIEFALAAAYDRLGEPDAAFRCLQAANDRRKAQYPWDVAGHSAFVERLIAAFNAALFRTKAGFGDASERPVFVVGMMRSGTTLIEQILASHPAVHGHGELQHVRQIARALPEAVASRLPFPECVAALDAATAQRLAAEHLAALERDAPVARRSIDKLPFNFARLGLIALLHPRARIIHCTRDPVDTCLSSYFIDFGPENRFTYDLNALGCFYRDYQRLMAHWRKVLPNPILDVPYEAVVADAEGWSRRLVDFLGLPWDDRCLAFYASERPVHTYSQWQVRQPIYSTSVARWRPYARYLGPLLEALGVPEPQ